MHRSFIKIDQNVLIMAIFSVTTFPKIGESGVSYKTGRNLRRIRHAQTMWMGLKNGVKHERIKEKI